MKLKGLFCLLLTLTVIIALASCQLIGGSRNKKFTVDFKDGDTVVSTQTVSQGSTVTKPADPTKEGYVFDGWYNGQTKWDFTKPVEENITLVAKWTEATPPCTHVDKDDNGKCDNCGVDFEDQIDIVTYSITYMDGETKLALEPASYSSKTAGLKLPTPEKAHYTFLGWYSDASLTNKVENIDINAGKNLTYYASFTPTVYTIRYSLSGGTNADTNPTTVDITNLPITLANPTKNNAEFEGWYSDFGYTQAITEINADNVGNMTIYAKWSAAAQRRTITYLNADGTQIGVDTYYASTEDQYILRQGPTVEGFRFIGWFDATDTSKIYECIPAGTDKNLTLKARMEDESKFYHSLSYYVDGKYHGMEKFVEDEGLAALATPSKGGYTFDGWYADASCTGDKVTSIAAGTTTDQRLYGKFIPNEYTIKYFDGLTEAELTLAPNTYSTSADAVALPTITEKKGYTIEGWYNEAGEKMTEIPAGYYGDLVLTAVYAPEVYTITYVLYGGENNENNVDQYTYDPEGSVPTLEDPTRDGYLFAGWYTNPAYSGMPVEDLNADENQNVTLYAKWTPVNEGNGGGSTLTPEVPF